MGEYTVYCHTNKTNGKKYVGVTSQNVTDRWQNGKHYSRHKNFYADILKYGWDNFEHQILYTKLIKSKAEKIEKDLIKKWELTNNLYGYNVRNGGNLHKFSKEVKEKIKAKTTGKNNPFYNCNHTEKTKELMRALKPTKKVKCVETSVVYISTREAERETHISHSDIIKCCKGTKNTAGKFHWQYLEEVV